MTDADSPRRLEHAAVQTVWLFQAFIAGLLFILSGLDIVRELDYPSYGADAYPILKDLFLAILAATIVYIVMTQRRYPEPHPKITAKFELAKGLLATAVWFWVLLDAIFYIPSSPYYYDPYCRYRAIRITLSAVSIAILCTCFYPTVFWSARLAKQAANQETVVVDDGSAGENTPLLRGG